MLIELLGQMSEKRGVSGDEGEIRAFLRDTVTPLADEVFTDTMGNLFAVKDGGDKSAPHVMLAAHMDEIGFMVTYISEDGLIHFDAAGGVDSRIAVSKRVHIGPDRTPGVIGAKAIHLQSPEDRMRVLGLSDLTIDIGVTSKKEAEKFCSVGTYVSFDTKFSKFGDGLVKGKALDDRVGCLALVRMLMDANYPGKLTCVFTVQEEVGMRGATVAAHRVNPDIAFVLEGTTCNDLGKVKHHKQVTRVGDGPVLTFMDRAAIAHPALLQMVLQVAEREGIPTQYKQAVAGGTDTGPIQRSRGGVAALAMAVPCRNIHSPCSVASISDIENEHKLLIATLRQIGAQNPLNAI